jgi:GNAT superfamily N-acetyltransferase
MDAKVRPARPSDKQPLMSFIKDVWGGTDYIPHVWNRWLKDPGGKMFVVESGGVPVGMNRIRFLEDGSAWFEGVRVHPDFRGRGLASLLGENSMKFAKKLGITTYRLTSGSHNHAAHRQIARINFKEIARFSVYEPPKGMKFTDRRAAYNARANDIAKVEDLIEETSEHGLAKGVFWHDFTATSLTHDVIKILVNEGAVHVFGRAVAITREGGEGTEIWEEFCFVGGPVDDALKLITATMGWSKKADVRWVFLPQGSPIVHAVRRKGFRRNFSMVLFERRPANG